MKKLLFLIFIALIACNKESEDEPLVISKVEYRIVTSIEGAPVKYMNSQGIEELAIMSQNITWVYSFDWEKELDSVGFKLKDYVNWTTYQIIVNEDSVVNYTGPVPDGGNAGWSPIYYKF